MVPPIKKVPESWPFFMDNPPLMIVLLQSPFVGDFPAARNPSQPWPEDDSRKFMRKRRNDSCHPPPNCCLNSCLNPLRVPHRELWGLDLGCPSCSSWSFVAYGTQDRCPKTADVKYPEMAMGPSTSKLNIPKSNYLITTILIPLCQFCLFWGQGALLSRGWHYLTPTFWIPLNLPQESSSSLCCGCWAATPNKAGSWTWGRIVLSEKALSGVSKICWCHGLSTFVDQYSSNDIRHF